MLDDRIAELEKDIAELEAEKAELKKVEKQLAAMNVEKKSEELDEKDLLWTTKIAELEKAIKELKAENEEMQLAAMNVELPLEKESELLDEHGKEPDEKDLLNKLLMATRKNFANALQRFLSLADAMDKDIRERLEATQENLDKIDKINQEVEKEREKDFDKIDQEEEKVKKRLDRIKATIREYTPQWGPPHS